MRSMMMLAAARPRSRFGWRIVVSAGVRCDTRSISSKPTTETSRGTAKPNRCSRATKAQAISSEKAKIPVGRSAKGIAAQISATACPDDRVKSPAKRVIGAPAAASAPARRDWCSTFSGGPPITPMRRWPRSRRCRTASRAPSRLSSMTRGSADPSIHSQAVMIGGWSPPAPRLAWRTSPSSRMMPSARDGSRKRSSVRCRPSPSSVSATSRS